MESILLVSVLLIVIFGSKPLFEMLRKKREGEELIGNPWEEIHAIPGYKESRKVAAFYPLTGEPNIIPILEQLADEGRLLLPRCTGPTTMEFCHVQNLKRVQHDLDGVALYLGEYALAYDLFYNKRYGNYDVGLYLLEGLGDDSQIGRASCREKV